MKRSYILLICVIFAGFAALLAGCGAKGSIDTDNAALTMRTYTVPESRAEALSDTLNHLMRMDNDKQDVGRAWVAGPGQLLVLAPAQMQDSIADSLKDIVSHEGPSNEDQPLRLNAWLVNVYPGQGQPDPALKSIQPALEAFAADLGPEHFSQANYFTAVSDAGSHTDLLPLAHYELSYGITKAEHGLLLKFEFHEPALDQGGQFNMLRGQVTTQLEQNLVLGLVADRSTDQHTGPIHQLLVIRIVPASKN